MTPDQFAAIKAATEQREGRTAFLYRDSAVAGNATCGIGHFVPDLAHAQSLPFQPPITQADWQRLMTAPRALPATLYAVDTRGRLSAGDIDALLDADLRAVESALAARFPEFAAFPNGPQAALVDMAFNLGIGGLLKFTHLVTAVGCKDWAVCAASCHRLGISEERNRETADLFLAGVTNA